MPSYAQVPTTVVGDIMGPHSNRRFCSELWLATNSFKLSVVRRKQPGNRSMGQSNAFIYVQETSSFQRFQSETAQFRNIPPDPEDADENGIGRKTAP